MSGLREIIEWVKREIILDPAQSVDEQFEDISRIFERDNRSPLADILRSETAEFLDFLGSRISRVQDESEADEDIRRLERSIKPLERSIKGILQGAKNLLKRIFG